MDDVLCDYTGAMNRCRETNPAQTLPQSQIDFYRNLVPFPDAVAAFKSMMTEKQYGDLIDPWILTAPSLKNPLSYTEKRIWTELHLGMNAVHKLIICSDKSLLKGHVLIDDQVKGKGQDRFEGVLIVPQMFDSWASIVRQCVIVAARHGVGHW